MLFLERVDEVEPEARYAYVGAVVVLLFCTITALIVWLNNKGTKGLSSFYLIYFKDISLSGLQVDGNVTMRGIKVGQVRSLQFSRRDTELVKILIEVQDDTPVKVDTKAVIQRNLLTGLASVDLVGGRQSVPPLRAIPPEEEFPVIPQGQTGLEAFERSLPDFLASLSETAANANRLIEEARQFFTPENQEALRTILGNLNHFMSKASGGDLNIGALVEEIRRSVVAVRTVFSMISEKKDTVGQILDLIAQRLGPDSAAVVGRVSETTDKLNAVLSNYDNPRALILGPHVDELGPGER